MNVSNLLRYDINNIQYHIDTKDATLNAKQNMPSHTLKTRSGQLHMESEPPHLRQDSTAFFASIGMRTMPDYMAEAAQRGKEAVLAKMAEYARDGKQLLNIDDGVTLARIYNQKLLARSDTTLVVKKAAPIEISFSKPALQTSYTPASASFRWNVDRAIRRYTPPDCGLTVTQPPSVDFTYTGGFQYVPPSAAEHLNALA